MANRHSHGTPGVTADLRVIATTTGTYGPVTVVVDSRTSSQQILLNSRQRLSGTQQALASQRHQSWVPLLLCQKPQRVFTFGMAAGISAAAALDFPITRLDAVELVPQVVDVARQHFGPWNAALFSDPRAHVITGDGRQLLAQSRTPYDVIVGDLFSPVRRVRRTSTPRSSSRWPVPALAPAECFAYGCRVINTTQDRLTWWCRLFSPPSPTPSWCVHHSILCSPSSV